MINSVRSLRWGAGDWLQGLRVRNGDCFQTAEFDFSVCSPVLRLRQYQKKDRQKSIPKPDKGTNDREVVGDTYLDRLKKSMEKSISKSFRSYRGIYVNWGEYPDSLKCKAGNRQDRTIILWSATRTSLRLEILEMVLSPHWGTKELIGVQLSLYVRLSISLSVPLYLCPVVCIAFWQSFVRPVNVCSASSRRPQGQISWVAV